MRTELLDKYTYEPLQGCATNDLFIKDKTKKTPCPFIDECDGSNCKRKGAKKVKSIFDNRFETDQDIDQEKVRRRLEQSAGKTLKKLDEIEFKLTH